jgi:RNA polymerase sigma-70 factor (ECF subfamily)
MSIPSHTRTVMLDPPATDPRVVAAWRAHRAYLVNLAYRMQGDVGAAEDTVQEAFIRLGRADLDEISDVRGWLTVTTSRLGLDQLRSAWHRRERPTDASRLEYTSGPVLRSAPDPADRITLDDTVREALLVVLERLTPVERVALILHDVFAVPFEEIALTLGRPVATCRQLASRARRKVSAERPGVGIVSDSDLRELTDGFLAACSNGNVDDLASLLHADVWGVADLLDSAGSVRSLPGPGQAQQGVATVSRTLMRFFAAATLVSLPSSPGESLLLAFADRRPYAVITLTVEGTLITRVHVLADPAVLRGGPSWSA